jgi:hypothetical protein
MLDHRSSLKAGNPPFPRSTIPEGAPSLSLRSVERQGGGVRRSQRSSGLVDTLPSCPGDGSGFKRPVNLHFITFSCCHRAALLAAPQARSIFEETRERVRKWYGLYGSGYVVMSEPVP